MTAQAKRTDTPGEAAARKLAVMQDCCANEQLSWNRFCEYHSGYADGYDAERIRRITKEAPAPDTEETQP